MRRERHSSQWLERTVEKGFAVRLSISSVGSAWAWSAVGCVKNSFVDFTVLEKVLAHVLGHAMTKKIRFLRSVIFHAAERLSVRFSFEENRSAP